MNINENTFIECHTPTVSQHIKNMDRVVIPTMKDTYWEIYEERSREKPDWYDTHHEYTIDTLADKIRAQFSCTQMQAMLVVCTSLEDLRKTRKQ